MSKAGSHWLDTESRDAVDFFWRSAGEREEFPRSLERSLAFALPVALVKLPHLQLKNVEHWLKARSVPFSFSCESRAMRGCLVAFKGQGIVFIDGTDPQDEQRVSVAHETAHFLLDYWIPRCRSANKHGSQILEAFDGLRPFTVNERLHSMGEGISTGVHTELLDRESSVEIGLTWMIENRADRVAMALLAPPEDVFSRVDLSAAGYPERLASLANKLLSHYGLPEYVSQRYAAELLHACGKGPSWSESLRQLIK